MARERSTNSALGKGWACPHARVSFDADLLCVLGWSPTGIDYGAPDGMPVSIIAMYLAPENQRRRFLREASVLVKALAAYPERGKLNSAKELSEIRGILLDLISSTEVTVGPGTMARMIRLQAGQIVPSKPADDLANLVVEPVTIIASPGAKPVVLARNLDLMDYLDSVSGVIEKLSSDGVFKNGGWRILKRGEVIYRGG
jgi:mannitol/fructose-specific phosphotransferase system IIA component